MSVEHTERGRRKTRSGTVVSRSGDKSVIVRTVRRLPHPLYGKIVKEFKQFHVHDERNAAKVGDLVEIMECRPLSRHKRWRLVERNGEGAQ